MKVILTLANKNGVDEAIAQLQEDFNCEIKSKTESRIKVVVNNAYISDLEFNTNYDHNYFVAISHDDPNDKIGYGLPMHYVLWATQVI